MSSSLPILIAGAGPAGLTCALTLRKNNIPVRIIEQSPKYQVGTRGAGIMPRSLELFQTLGVLDELQSRRGLEAPPTQIYQGGETKRMPPLMETMDPTPSKPISAMWFVSQAELEDLLRKELRKYDCEVELGTKLVGFEQDQDGVTAHISQDEGVAKPYRASYLVGSDGARGVTRKLLDCHFLGETKDEKGMLVGNVVIDNITPEIWHLFKPSAEGLISLRPYDKEHKKFVITATGLPEVAEGETTPESFEQLFRKHTKRDDVTFGTFEWLSYFKPKILVVDKMSKGRVFLVGDAAHVHPPHGGQGLNTSVQDAFNLCWKLALVHRGSSPTSLLDSYDAERLPVITEMLRQVLGIYNKSNSDSNAARSTPARGKQLYMLGINYRWSSIILPVDGGSKTPVDVLTERAYVGWEDEVQPGDRAPECPELLLDGEKTSLFKLLTPTKHTVLVFGGESSQKLLDHPAPFREEVMDVFVVLKGGSSTSSACRTLVDVGSHAHTAYRATDGRVMVAIVRPDGIIGAMAETAEDVKKYFSLVFGTA